LRELAFPPLLLDLDLFEKKVIRKNEVILSNSQDTNTVIKLPDTAKIPIEIKKKKYHI
jgi:hypothetical protein